MVPVNFGKKIPKDALKMLSVKSDSMMRPGTMNAAYSTPSTAAMPEPTVRELLEVAVEAARLAGRRTLDYFQAGIAV